MLPTVTINIDVDIPDASEFATSEIRFALSGVDTDSATGRVVTPEPVIVPLNSASQGAANLWPVDRGINGRTYSVTVYAMVAGCTDRRVYVLGTIQPLDAGAQSLAALLQAGGAIVAPAFYSVITQAEYEQIAGFAASTASNAAIATSAAAILATYAGRDEAVFPVTSPDGQSAFVLPIVPIDKTSVHIFIEGVGGLVTLAQSEWTLTGATITLPTPLHAPGRLIARFDAVDGTDAYRKTNIVGTVAQSAGVPTGAIIQRGSGANGQFTRFADGTQICWHIMELGSILANGIGVAPNVHRTAPQQWSFPALFASAEVSVSANPILAVGSTVPRRILTPVFAVPSASAVSAVAAARVLAIPDDDNILMHVRAVGRWF